ncbi:MAG TPA: hypothetical protein VH592_03325 [Gemmataceae bacterium]|jgi:hypothetical protein
MSSTPSTPRVSSPASTGGAGTFFEQHVAAYWLAQLLVRSIPPILTDCTVVEVHFQTERLGFHTDDFLVVGENGSGTRRKLLGQVKRTFTVSASDEECKKAVQDFWKDFQNAASFSSASDRFALVTFRGTNTLLEHCAGLLDCARAARDGAEFEARLKTPGFISAKAVSYCDEIRAIIGESEGREVAAAELWPFLRVFHVLSLDLNSGTRQTESAIKPLLAHTTSEPDALGTADASWKALLSEVGEGMPEARTYRRDDLPEPLRRRHSPAAGTDHRALRALGEHAALILGGIRSTIGEKLHLARGRLVQDLVAKLDPTQVILVSGAAGSGKSGIAKDAIAVLSQDHFTFSFRAEEFAAAHFDETLQRNQIPVNAATLGAMLAAQGRKILLVESVERLLEAATRDAFTDLLTLVANDRSWQLILTCRDYSADLVRSCFLERIGHYVVTVPPLDDEELREVEVAHPTLSRPLGNPALRQLLRNPYILDKALQILWSEGRPLPQSEREFRVRFWQEIVRADQRAARGMPQRREGAFVEVALRRARALTLYAPCADLDSEVVDALRLDSLIVSSRESKILVAPAHDVLEDWAILHWIDQQNAIHESSVLEFSAAIGTHPAVRRTYRKWVQELVERDASASDRLFHDVVHQSELPSQFRDDTLVSLLRSPSSTSLLQRHSTELFANDKQLLRRVIHLLRVACVTAPAWLQTTTAPTSLFNMPDGPAWACVLRLVKENLASFTQADRPLLLGFIEDWARGVSWQSPYPEGAESAASIAYWLLPSLDDYRSEDQRKRTLRVIAKIPNADRERFTALLDGTSAQGRRERSTSDLREIIFEGLEGMPAARDVPDLIVSVANRFLLCTEADLQRERGFSSDLEVATLFGIKQGLNHDYFPASAYRGPFLPLLRCHLAKGLAFIIGVFNHSADWYAQPRVPSRYVEPPIEMTLTFADGTSRKQWCNGRLWTLYRGMSVGPYVLQSLLMALERALLEFAEVRPHEVDAVLLFILKHSDSAALTAVVASVATAFPHGSGETLLVLLRSPLCIFLDRERFAHEATAPSRMLGMMPRLNSRNEVYESERKEADAFPHRRRDLEMAAADLQLGPRAPQIREILDRHRAELPPAKEQDDYHRAWRLSIHRMDLRQYTVTEDLPEAAVPDERQAEPPEKQQYVRLDLKAPDPDVKEMMDKSAAQFQAMNARLALSNWGMKVFRHEGGATYDPGQWRQWLQEARALSGKADSSDEDDLAPGGPGYVAAVCVRDHWEEMSGEERDWCVNLVCLEVERAADHWNQYARVQRYEMSSDRPCAWVVSLLVGKSLETMQDARVRKALVLALTHAIDEVRWCAAWGIGRNLWQIDREMAFRCVNALATEAALVQNVVDTEYRRPRTEREFLQPEVVERRTTDEIEAECAAIVRQRFFETNGIPSDAHETFDPARWFGAEANGRILAILREAPSEPAAIAGFQRLARTLVSWWDQDDEHRHDMHERRPERNHDTESAQADHLKNFLLKTSLEAATAILEPILEAVDKHPREVHWILLGLIGAEDRTPNTKQFWSLWALFADRVRRANWLEWIDNEHPSGDEMMSAIFLGTWWKEEVRHWRSLEGHAEHINALFENLPLSSTVLDDYVRFLYHVGEQSLPGAFSRIAKRLQGADQGQMLKKGNTIFLLEILLQRHVYGKPLELKRQPDLRNAILVLLDILVENGSSAAFRMRDDFVTPLPSR